MGQPITYLILLAEIMIVLKHRKYWTTIAAVSIYAVLFEIVAIDQQYLLPKFVGYVSAFIVALHLIVLIGLSGCLLFKRVLRGKLKFSNDFWVLFILCTLLITICGYSISLITFVNKHEIRTDKVNRTVRVVQVSDLHLSNIYGAKEVRKLVNKINTLRPDIVCITGDVFNSSVSTDLDLESIYREFSRLDPEYGVYVCPGNHDEYLMSDLSVLCYNSGFTLLRDRRVIADGVEIIGRDYGSGRKDMAEMRTDEELFTIILDHVPSKIEEEISNGADLILAGHTHGGQLVPIKMVFKLFYGIYSGIKEYDGATVVVNQGARLIYPYCRIVSKSEIVCIDIKPEE